MATSVSKRKFKCREALLLLRRFSCRRDTDIHTTQRINLVVLDFRENDLFLDTDVVVTTTIERFGQKHRGSHERVAKLPLRTTKNSYMRRHAKSPCKPIDR